MHALAQAVHAAIQGDDLVLLDVAADAYFCLPGGALGLDLDPLRGTLTSEDPDVVGILSAVGLLSPTHSAPSRLRRAPPPLPTGSALSVLTPPPAWFDAATALRGVVDVALHYRGRSFSDVLRAASQTPRAGSGRTGDLLELVGRFHAWAPYAPVSAKCLLRSFMLLRLLRRAGHDVQWVFGVATWPFRAHCWLQVGDVVLDDSVESLAAYQPILVV
jgi:hypothetical protein